MQLGGDAWGSVVSHAERAEYGSSNLMGRGCCRCKTGLGMRTMARAQAEADASIVGRSGVCDQNEGGDASCHGDDWRAVVLQCILCPQRLHGCKANAERQKSTGDAVQRTPAAGDHGRLSFWDEYRVQQRTPRATSARR